MNEDVLKYILKRKNTGNKNDGRKIGLIFEGGGMRGVFGGGVARGLSKMGLRDCFDVVYGSSSGSCSATYFLSGETTKGDSIYYENLDKYKFIKPWRLSNLMDIDHLGDIFRDGKKSLTQQIVKDSDTLLKIYVSNATTGTHKCFTNKDKIDLVKLMMASCAAPGFYNKPVKIGRIDYLDGNVEKKLPIEEALKDNCTDILVVSTAKENYKARANVLSSLRKSFLMKKLNPTFKKAHDKRLHNYNRNLDIAFGKVKLDNGNIYTISPKYMISVAENRAEILKKYSNHGYSKTLRAFERVEQK